MSLGELDYRWSPRKKMTSTKPVVCVGHETVDQLQSGQAVELDEVIIIPASDFGTALVEEAQKPFFRCNGQQWFAISSIEAVADYGGNITVTLKSGRKMNIDIDDKERFFAAIGVI